MHKLIIREVEVLVDDDAHIRAIYWISLGIWRCRISAGGSFPKGTCFEQRAQGVSGMQASKLTGLR